MKRRILQMFACTVAGFLQISLAVCLLDRLPEIDFIPQQAAVENHGTLAQADIKELSSTRMGPLFRPARSVRVRRLIKNDSLIHTVSLYALTAPYLADMAFFSPIEPLRLFRLNGWPTSHRGPPSHQSFFI